MSLVDPVLIVGAGMAGLTCAARLHRCGVPFVLFDSADRVGGRLKTDRTEDGFLLDHGFQVLLSAYPEVKRELDLAALCGRAFCSGAVIRTQQQHSIHLRDPLRDPLAILSTLRAPIGSLFDKIQIARLIWDVLVSSPESLLAEDSGGTLEFLKERGISPRCLEVFFKPFFGGVFLDRSLSVDRRFFKFVFQQFVFGRVLLPEGGMQRVPEQIASRLPRESVRLSSTVVRADKNAVELADGKRLRGKAVVLAVEGHAISKFVPQIETPADWKQTTCLYFGASGNPGKGDGYLRLNALPNALVHNVCFPSDIAPEYAPSGQSLVSVSVHGKHGYSEDDLLNRVKKELVEWFGNEARDWKHLRTYKIPFALPSGLIRPASLRVIDGVYVCGDHLAYPSLNASMATGRIVAEDLVRTCNK